jgi:hypothetical protein
MNCPTGKIRIRGIVLVVRRQHTEVRSVYQEIVVWKMSVLDDRGFRVWGTVPKSLIGKIERGTRIEFWAKVRSKGTDPNFGTYQNPRDARIVTEST